MLSDAIISMLIVSGTGLLGLAFKLCYSSRCNIIKCCGAEIHRDVEHETRINIDNNANNNSTPRI